MEEVKEYCEIQSLENFMKIPEKYREIFHRLAQSAHAYMTKNGFNWDEPHLSEHFFANAGSVERILVYYTASQSEKFDSLRKILEYEKLMVEYPEQSDMIIYDTTDKPIYKVQLVYDWENDSGYFKILGNKKYGTSNTNDQDPFRFFTRASTSLGKIQLDFTADKSFLYGKDLQIPDQIPTESAKSSAKSGTFQPVFITRNLDFFPHITPVMRTAFDKLNEDLGNLNGYTDIDVWILCPLRIDGDSYKIQIGLTGTIKPNETAKNAVIRELGEEIGLYAKEEKAIIVHSAVQPARKQYSARKITIFSVKLQDTQFLPSILEGKVFDQKDTENKIGCIIYCKASMRNAYLLRNKIFRYKEDKTMGAGFVHISAIMEYLRYH